MVTLRPLAPGEVTRGWAETLRRDWYYRHASYVPDGESVIMSIPDVEPMTVLRLALWLGSEAEILAPQELRNAMCEKLELIRRSYDSIGGGGRDGV